MQNDFFSFHLRPELVKCNVGIGGIYWIYCCVLKFNATESEAILHDISFRSRPYFRLLQLHRHISLEAMLLILISIQQHIGWSIFDVLFEFQWQKKEHVNGREQRGPTKSFRHFCSLRSPTMLQTNNEWMMLLHFI